MALGPTIASQNNPKPSPRGNSKTFERLFASLLHGSLSLQEKVNFSRHLSIIIKAGLPLLEGLKLMKKQSTSKTLINVLDALIEDVNNGQSLATALAKYRDIFGDFFISVVEVGETSGTLGENLLYIAEEMKKSRTLRAKVRSAMIYPIILMVMTVVIAGFLTFFIFPKLIGAFSSLNIKLPLVTQILIDTLAFLKSYGVFLAIGLVAAVIGWKLLMRLEWARLLYHKFLLYIPVVSTLMIKYNLANFARLLGVLLKGGMKIVESVIIVSGTFDNLVYRKALLNAAEEIKKGGALAEFLSANRHAFPPILSAMIEVGENTGNLEENLFYLADYYTEEVDIALKDLTALMEPLIIVIMGLIVGFVALAVITPIYSLSKAVH
ncbi:MAG: type II secretion system F family protein [bacterium]|nr:type II secretion system F family protein [bacterium]